MVQRIKTGIPGLDSLMEGGLVEGSVALLAGTTGSGKTIASCQYIYAGLERGEPGVLITLEESPEDIREDALQFGWDFAKYEKKGLCRIIYHDPSQLNNLGGIMVEEIGRMKAKRLVIDSTSVMSLNIDNPAQVRRKLYNLITNIKRGGGTTALLTAEIPEGRHALSTFGVEEFVADAVIVLHYVGVEGAASRTLMIRKMRRTSHGRDVYPMEITKKGVTIKHSDL
ncbi:MAG: AAA family ATPase [Candidatus Aenigmarchaeota archaeon]|nr:AAA family ATPase [Candidatus Aenigmarchaeota archaeon]